MPTDNRLEQLRQQLLGKKHKPAIAAAAESRPESRDQSGAIPESTIPEADKQDFLNVVSQEDVARTNAILNGEDAGAEQPPLPQGDMNAPIQPTPPMSSDDSPASSPQPVQPPPLEEVVKGVGDIQVKEAPEGDDLAAALKEYNKAVNIAMDSYRKEKNSLKQKEMWDGIIKGVGLMLAGAYGMKTGTDMGGVKIDRADWAGNLRNAQAELQSSLGQAGRSFNLKKDISDEAAKRNQRMWERSFALAKEKRLGEDAMLDLAVKSRTAAAKAGASSNKAADKETAAHDKEVKRIEKEINNRVDKYANPKATDEQKELYKEQINQLNEKYKNLTGKSMADTSKREKWWGLSDRDPTPSEMLGGGEGMPTQPSGNVKMMSPEGKPFFIPAENVQKAIDGGWTKV